MLPGLQRGQGKPFAQYMSQTRVRVRLRGTSFHLQMSVLPRELQRKRASAPRQIPWRKIKKTKKVERANTSLSPSAGSQSLFLKQAWFVGWVVRYFHQSEGCIRSKNQLVSHQECTNPGREGLEDSLNLRQYNWRELFAHAACILHSVGACKHETRTHDPLRQDSPS